MNPTRIFQNGSRFGPNSYASIFERHRVVNALTDTRVKGKRAFSQHRKKRKFQQPTRHRSQQTLGIRNVEKLACLGSG